MEEFKEVLQVALIHTDNDNFKEKKYTINIKVDIREKAMERLITSKYCVEPLTAPWLRISGIHYWLKLKSFGTD